MSARDAWTALTVLVGVLVALVAVMVVDWWIERGRR